MAEICRFFGIIIQMFGSDHNPPHFHAIYNEYRALLILEQENKLRVNFLPGS